MLRMHEPVQDAVRRALAARSNGDGDGGGLAGAGAWFCELACACVPRFCCLSGPQCRRRGGGRPASITAADCMSLAAGLVMEEMLSRDDADGAELAAPHALRLIEHRCNDLMLMKARRRAGPACAAARPAASRSPRAPRGCCSCHPRARY